MALRKRVSQSVAAVATLAVATAFFALPALAHVEVESSDVAADGAATVTFGFHHGCDGQPTTALRIQIPVGVTDVVPESVDGWTVNNSATEFGWSGGSIPDGEEGSFTATMTVSGQAGDVIWFPTVQQCPTADELWDQIGEPGRPEPEMVAPSITLTETISAPSTTTAAPGDGSSAGPPPVSATIPSGLVTETTVAPGTMPETSESNTGGLIVGLVTVAIIAGGALLLYLRNRRPKPAGPATEATEAPGSGDPDGTGEGDSGRSRRSPH